MTINSIVLIAIIIILLANTIGAIITVFHRPRSISSILSWLLVLFFFPVVGFLFYAFFGRGLAEEKLFTISSQDHVGLNSLKSIILKNNKNYESRIPDDTSNNCKKVINYFDRSEDSPLTRHNGVKLFTDGDEKFNALFEDIKNATESIHIEYYSIFNDNIGNKLLTLLAQKAEEGVEVKVLYDSWGSAKTRGIWFRKFEKSGVKVLPFITGRNVIAKARLNYHLHRKIVVIDGIYGWIGGFNVGDQYLGESKKFGYWRDTHARIHGSAAFLMQERFIMDWNASVRNVRDQINFESKYFPENKIPYDLNTRTQIIGDGPDRNEEVLKGGFISMILNAKKHIYIQTPYLVPDDSMMDALKIAARSGVQIEIMIPDMPDHAFIYRATQYYANYLTGYGIKVYNYHKGFLHAKTAVFDDQIGVVGSMNHDFRSYSLNFEANAYFYNSNIAGQLRTIFNEDIKHSTLITEETIAQQSHWLSFKQYFSRLLSPIL
ncbi:cardiolipin synthase [Companilactobacillus sp. RD055328]|uniref:cardiolipin synthase n=1 Tax=Companilactobacillus sp. RD055328 TaxID=2916634 RepID=UPI001FC88AF8|nr:cardiolipin synthase [Companilactobacillus sp. RD055328]GKQ43271.1 cardiolipin synthase [Companilactobacillus sp. RD055328]